MKYWNRYAYLAVLLLLVCGIFYSLPGPAPLSIPMEPFPEAPWRTPNTLKTTTIASTPFARFELHQVRTESGVIVNDWMWTDERSHVNILIHLKKENKYLLFFQNKYGLEKPALATLGGLFNTGETALQCAARELEEETGLVAGEMVPLGKYRVQVNRGGGFLYAYLARNSAPLEHSEATNRDYEKQERRLLSRRQLLAAVLGGELGEAQWVATAALGLLREEVDSGGHI